MNWREHVPPVAKVPYWGLLWARSRKGRDREAHVGFRCNLCGRRTTWGLAAMTREAHSCRWCGSTVRFRNVADAVVTAAYGRSGLPADMPPQPLDVIGFSDPRAYARHLQRLFNYENSFFHQFPRRDLMDLDSFGSRTYDLVVCSEVLEHVGSPVETAFATLYAITRPGGAVVLSSPMVDGLTREHFAGVVDLEVRQDDYGWIVKGAQEDGTPVESRELTFHGGPGSTLEMRLFGRDDFVRNLRQAGFVDIEEKVGDRPEFGIVTEGTPTSLETRGGTVHGMHAGVWIARRPADDQTEP